MRNIAAMAAAFGAGAALIYLGDSRNGRARRARLANRATHVAHEATGAMDVVARDLSHREHGMAARMRGSLRRETPDDDVVAERVRSRLGRVASHPHAIEVHCTDGRVVLGGDIFAYERDEVLRAASHVRGVRGVDDKMRVHVSPEGVPRLQGGRTRDPMRRWKKKSWSPTTRFLGGMGGVALAGYGMGSRGPVGAVARIGGALLLIRSFLNLDFGRMFGIGARGRGIDVQKTIHVAAPLEEVYTFLSAPENFPRFMRHVRGVSRLSDGRYRWTVAGPAGIPFTWEAMVTENVPNERLRWRTTHGALVENEGVIRFESLSPMLTRVNIRISYRPPVGMVGHALASLFGADPKRELDDDLLRFVSLLEGGKTRGRMGDVTVDDVNPVTH
jgi:uncharacterized membrane protein